jgi:hypothetical protein
MTMSMMRRKLLYFSFSLLLVTTGWAQRQEDTLSPQEVDQVRDAALSAEERLKLYVNFARARLDALEQSRTDQSVKDHAKAIHDHLQDFLAVYDELDENVDTYADRKDDMRKALKTVIDGDTEFQAKLRGIEDSTTATPRDKTEYEFLLTSALHAVDDGAQDHRQLLAEQEEAAKHKKKPKNDNPNGVVD